MRVAVLSSGSKGNSTLVETSNTKILIDDGVTKSYLEEKLSELDTDPKDIKAILITHTHVDHVQGLKVFLKKYHPVLYVTEKLIPLLNEYIDDYTCVTFENNKAQIDDIEINVIKTSHDSGESVGFIVKSNEGSVVYITDTGYINEKYFEDLKNHNLYVLESNHDVEMLMNGSYPYQLKRRILGNKGHLSNDDAAYYLSKFIGSKTKTIVLAHLSDENNTYDKAYETVVGVLKAKNKRVKNIIIAKQKQRTDFIEV